MFPHPNKTGWVIAEFKFGNAIAQYSFNPADANFGTTPFDWTKAKPFIYTGHGGWGHMAGAMHVGIFAPGDANADGKVDLTDLTMLASNWQGTDRTYSTGDFSQDGVVDQADLTIIANNWPSSATAGFAQAVKAFPQLAAAPAMVTAAKAADDKVIRTATPPPMAVMAQQPGVQPVAPTQVTRTVQAAPGVNPPAARQTKSSAPNVRIVWMVASVAGVAILAGMYIPAWRRKRLSK